MNILYLFDKYIYYLSQGTGNSSLAAATAQEYGPPNFPGAKPLAAAFDGTTLTGWDDVAGGTPISSSESDEHT
jgi:hypothetical protein